MEKLYLAYFGLEKDIIDIEKMISDFENDNFFEYKNNEISLYSPFTSKDKKYIVEFQKVSYKDQNGYFRLLLLSQLVESITILNEDKQHNKINKKALEPYLNLFVDKAIEFGMNNNLSFFEFISYLFYKVLYDEKFENGNKSLSIIYISYLLNFLGYFIKFDKKYQHAGLNYWTSLIDIEYDNKNINYEKIVRFKNILVDNLSINYLNPIYFDDEEEKDEGKQKY